MRETIKRQQSLTQPPIDHEHARELSAISDILDRAPEILTRVLADITKGRRTDRGRVGMTADSVLRILVIKQMHRFSYDELAFELTANSVYRAFCKIGDFDRAPKRSTLQSNLKRLSAETLVHVNLHILEQAKESKVEDGKKIRSDCTNVASNIHEPSDSTLLWDVVRVLTRTMKQLQELVGGSMKLSFSDHTLRAKRRMLEVMNASSMKKRVPLYRDLIGIVERTMVYSEQVSREVADGSFADVMVAVRADALSAELSDFAALGAQVVDQSRRRVLNGESVPVAEKIVSIFEPHTDILVKGRREVEYGHKICVTTGASSLILDCVITSGNPSDSTLALTMLEGHVEHYGEAPRQAVFDGGFASKDNVKSIKELGVQDVAFSKRCGLAITDMVKSTWVYKRLRKFRAGVEGNISFFKRCFGGSRCTWSGLRSFKTYVWASIVSCNLLVLARHNLAAS